MFNVEVEHEHFFFLLSHYVNYVVVTLSFLKRKQQDCGQSRSNMMQCNSPYLLGVGPLALTTTAIKLGLHSDQTYHHPGKYSKLLL